MKVSEDEMNGDFGLRPVSSCCNSFIGNNSVHVACRDTQTGFTILEVIVSLIIVGVSLTTFIKLLGNSTLLRVKINDHHERLNVAVTKAEEAFLGLLDGSGVKGVNKNKWQGTIQDSGIRWSVEEEKDEGEEEKDEKGDSSASGAREIFFYTVFVEGVELSSVRIQ